MTMRMMRKQRLAVALALALAGAPLAAEAVAVPLSWPLPGEDRSAPTPLRAAMEAMRSTKPAHREHRAARIAVTRCDDDDQPGSLRHAVANAMSGDLVDLGELACSTITIGDQLESTADDLWLRGPGADALVIDGGGADRILFQRGVGTLTIENLTFANGRVVAEGTDIAYGGCIAAAGYVKLVGAVVRDCEARGVGAYGGAILSGGLVMKGSTISGNTAFGDHATNGTAAYGGGAFVYGIDMVDSTISGNRAIGTHNPPMSHWEIGGGLFVARSGGLVERSTIAGNYAMRYGGGIAQEDALVVRNSTISGNVARDDDGGGVRIRQTTAATFENTTITANHAGRFGGGVSFRFFATSQGLSSTIIAGNTSGDGSDLAAETELALTGSHNLVGNAQATVGLPADTLTGDPRLLPLADNSGRTRTHALAADSPALDAGTNAGELASDQRGFGFTRVAGAAPDIGAFERQGAAPVGDVVALPALGAATATWLAIALGMLGGLGLRRRTRSG